MILGTKQTWEVGDVLRWHGNCLGIRNQFNIPKLLLTVWLVPVEWTPSKGTKPYTNGDSAINVMAQAHKATKAIVARKALNGIKGNYAAILKAQLKQAHKEYKAMQANKIIKPDTRTEAGQLAIVEMGKEAFKAQTSENPFKDGSHAHSLFREGWIIAKRDHYKITESDNNA